MKPTTIKQQLMCDLTDTERREYGIVLATTLGDIEEIEAEKKKHSDHFKDRIAGLQARADETSRKVRDGKEWRNVECQVLLGTPDRDHKQTIRLDTGETIRTEMMTDSDRQLVMPLDDDALDDDDHDSRDEWTPVGDPGVALEIVDVDEVTEGDQAEANGAAIVLADADTDLLNFLADLNTARGVASRAALLEQYIEQHGTGNMPRIHELAVKWPAKAPVIKLLAAQVAGSSVVEPDPEATADY